MTAAGLPPTIPAVPGLVAASDIDPAAARRWPTVAEQLRDAREARDAGMAQAEAAAGAAWDRAVIDQAIDAFAATGDPFSANDFRDLLPNVHAPLLGARFAAAAAQRRIRQVGFVTSTKENTHCKPVARWVGIPSQEREQQAGEDA